MKLSVESYRGLGSEYRSLLRIGTPLIVTQLGVMIVSFADTIMVSRHSTEELAAASFVNNFFLVAIVMLIGFASGLTPLIGALFTSGGHERAGRTFRSALQLNVLAGFVFSIVMGVLYFTLDALGQPAELMPLIKEYYLIVLLTLIPMAMFNCCQQMANGVTDTAMPMWLMLGGNALNIIGNYALIFGNWGFPELGLRGAGISTFAARAAQAAAIMAIIRFSDRYRSYRAGFAVREAERGVSVKVIQTGWPIMLQSGIECLMWSFGAVVCGWFGKEQLAGYQIVTTMGQLGFMTYIGIGIAVSILVANCMGTNDVARIRRVASAGIHFNLILSTIASAVFILGGERLLRLFNSDPAVISVAMTLILPLVLYQYCDASQITYANALRGTSCVRPLFRVALICYVIAGVPVELFLAKVLDLGASGVYFSFVVALLLALILLRYYFYRAIRPLSAPKES